MYFHCSRFFWCQFALSVFLLFSSVTLFGQHTKILPDPGDCVSQDLLIVEASLQIADPCFNCPNGTEEFPLVLKIDNKTGSFRPTFAFWATLVYFDADGNIIEELTESISGCNDTSGLPDKEVTTLTTDTYVSYICGNTMQLTDIYLAWTDASIGKKNSCEAIYDDPRSKITPKCGTSTGIVIETPLNATASSEDVSCKGGSDGSVTVSFNGGEGPYNVRFNGGTATTEISPKTYSNLSAGTYTWEVTDKNGCTHGGTEEIGEPVVLSADVDPGDASCFGGEDGEIIISNAAGGSNSYEYSIDGGAIWSTSGEFTGLSADDYSVFIRDANATACYIDLGPIQLVNLLFLISPLLQHLNPVLTMTAAFLSRYLEEPVHTIILLMGWYMFLH